MNRVESRIKSLIAIMAPSYSRTMQDSATESKQIVQATIAEVGTDAACTANLVNGDVVDCFAGARQVIQDDKCVIIGGRVFN